MKRLLAISGGFLFGSIIATLVMSCGGDGGSKPRDIGEVCSDLSDSFCQRAVECHRVANYTVCVNDWMRGCCTDKNACGNEVRATVTWGEVYTCGSDILHMDCNALGMFLPTSCLQW